MRAGPGLEETFRERPKVKAGIDFLTWYELYEDLDESIFQVVWLTAGRHVKDQLWSDARRWR